MRTHKYGAKNRKKIDKAYNSLKDRYECRNCRKTKVVKNKSFSLWRCASCGKIYAGGAYSLRTDSGLVSERIIKEYVKSE